MNKYLGLLFLLLSLLNTPLFARSKKIIGLVGARNEERFLEQCLRSLALYVDAIVYLDDASTDNSLAIVKSLARECKVKTIISKDVWFRDEVADRNALLTEGRKLGGTHFICVDADEMLSANCVTDRRFRKIIRKLKPGQGLRVLLASLWRSCDVHRTDATIWWLPCIFCDDGKSLYGQGQSGFIHVPRLPRGIEKIENVDRSFRMLHFQFAYWPNQIIKQAWYRCLERIRNPNKSIEAINKKYQWRINEQKLTCEPVPTEWFAGYDFFDEARIMQPEYWRVEQILQWFDKYGRDYFEGLEVLQYDWEHIHHRVPANFFV